MKQKFASLVEVKKIIALLLTIVFVTMEMWKGGVSEVYKTAFLIIIGFYFGQSTVAQTQIRSHELNQEPINLKEFDGLS